MQMTTVEQALCRSERRRVGVQIYRGRAGTMQVGEEAGRSADRPRYSRHSALFR